MRLRHLLRQERGVGVARLGALAARAAARGLAPLRELLFEPRDDRVRQLARAHQVAVPLRHGKVGARLLQARARRLALLERLPLRAPRGAQLLRRRLLGVQQPADLAPPRRDVHARLAPQRLELDLQVEHLALQVRDRLRLGLVLQPQPARSLVEEADGIQLKRD